MGDDKASRQSNPSNEPVYQPPLFESAGRARLIGHTGQIADLTPGSSFDIARYWFRRYLEQSGYPRNTVDAYSYDLSILNSMIGSKRIDKISSRDIAQYLDASLNRSTRKRRLTSVSSFFRYLITQAQVLDRDPARSFHPDSIPLKTPKPLFASEQKRLIDAAEQDGARAHAIIWLFLNLGLTRGELLRLRHPDIDLSESGSAVIYVFYEHPRHSAKERKLATDPEFVRLYERLDAEHARGEYLFEMLPQSVNRLIERVATAAGIEKTVSPQSLRDTFAVNQARNGLEERELLEILGLANDARNRTSVQRYVKLARPPLQPGRADARSPDDPDDLAPDDPPADQGEAPPG